MLGKVLSRRSVSYKTRITKAANRRLKLPHESPRHKTILEEILMLLGEMVRGLKEMGKFYIPKVILS